MAKQKKKKKSTQKQCAVFTYDLFPYMVVHNVLGIRDDGSIVFGNVTMSADSLVAIFPRKIKKDIENRLNYMQKQYRLAQEDSRNKLLNELSKHIPALKKECERHYAE